jgi:hypothetical protein
MQPTFHESTVSMQHSPRVKNLGGIRENMSDFYGHDVNDNDAVNGIDITKSLYHLRLHGFDVIAKDYQANSGTLSPTRVACVTPAVSPVNDVHSYRKRPSHLQQGMITPSITSRPLSPIFLDKTPTRTRRLTLASSPKQASGKKLFDGDETCSRPKHSFDKKNHTEICTEESHSNATTDMKPLHRVLPTTISDGEDEFEVMLESSISSDDCDDGSKDDLRNESIITDSPQSLQSMPQNENDKDMNHDESCDTCENSFLPDTPATFNFCGIPSWCDTTVSYSTSRHLFLDDCSMSNSFQLQHRSTSEWLLCPTSSTGCCVPTWNENDPPNVDTVSRQITVVQSMLQNHICTSLGDSIESLCWQKSAASVMSKSSSSGNAQLNSTTCSGAETKREKPKHRRSSTLPLHKRIDKFASLQYNLRPFDSVPIAPLSSRNRYKPYSLTKSQSFQPSSNRCNPQQFANHSIRGNSSPNVDDHSIVSTEWECGALDFALAFENGDEVTVSNRGDFSSSGNRAPSLKEKEASVNADGGYESDPEIICRKLKSEQLKKENPKPFPSQPSNTLQEFLNERNTFIWHTNNSKSIAVHVWIELGQQLYDRLLLPKLCWKPILSTVNSTTLETKRTNIDAGAVVSSMELLSICRIRPVVNNDREQYPFAQTQRLFSIHSTVNSFDSECPTQHHSIVLEARSIADRIRFTNLLKLTVSNLAAKFITNDPNTLTMYFHNPTISDYVP